MQTGTEEEEKGRRKEINSRSKNQIKIMMSSTRDEDGGEKS